MAKKSDIYIDDPDDCRKRYTRKQRIWRRTGWGIIAFLGLIIYLFLPPWLYPVLVVPFMYFVYNTDRSPRTERQRIRAYLGRIPPSAKLSREKFLAAVDISDEDIAEILEKFDQLPDRDADYFSAAEMKQTILCWYYYRIKQCSAESVKQAVFKRN